ncbi:MAG TPA: hypothetical protein VME42_07290 [Steroidobacteraceae bacterium]|nr:hypothetical protein [Steroidobacteraceae bacterium]
MKDPMRDTLDERLARLPREVVPPRYLWPSITREIARRPRSTPQMVLAAAAAVAAVSLAAGVVWTVLHSRVTPVAAPAAPSLALDLDEPRNAQYLAARAALLQTFQQRLALLDPGTRAKIEANLAVIQKARDDIRKALAQDPDSPVLAQLLQSAWQDEFDLYDDVIRTTQPTLARI